MSRSRKKTPMSPITTARSEKLEKQWYNRRLRHNVREAIHQEKEVLPDLKEHSDPWSMAKDSKYRFDPRQSPKLLRK